MYLISTECGQSIPVPEGTSTIGRGTECEICIQSQNVSRQHCVITWRRGRLTICDGESANGIRVNGRRVDTSELHTGDTLQIADLSYRVSDTPSAAGDTARRPDPTTTDASSPFDLTNPTARVWYFRKNRSVVGPATLSVLKQWAASGEFSRSDEIRQDPNPEWFPADTMAGLFPAVTETESSEAATSTAEPTQVVDHREAAEELPEQSPAAGRKTNEERGTPVPERIPPETVRTPPPVAANEVSIGDGRPAGNHDIAPSKQCTATIPRKPRSSWRPNLAVDWTQVVQRIPSVKVLLLVATPICVFAVQHVLSGGPPADQPELGRVRGTVTLDGAALPEVMITFEPENGRPSMGLTDEQGGYELQYTAQSSGARIGRHTVRIFRNPDPMNLGSPETHLDSGEGLPTAGQSPIPAQYNISTILEANVVAGDNPIDFDLKTTE